MRVAILFFAAAAGLCAQSFDVASVKVNKSGDGSSSTARLSKGKLLATNSAMRSILQVAWGLSSLQVNGPPWIDSERFDLAGSAPEGVPDTDIKPMLQALLKDRFHLQAHLEKRETQVFNLVVLKGGPKIKAITPDFVFPEMAPRLPGEWGRMVGALTMDQLAYNLTGMAGRPVVNKTSLEGRYYCLVQCAQLGAATEPDQTPDIFGAVQQQLGLKLEPGKADLDVLVIDHIDRTPTEN